MFHFRHIRFQKALAAFLIALLAFIYAEKALHSHEREFVSKHLSVTHHELNAECAICDFKIAKEAELPGLAIASLPVSFVVSAYADNIPAYVSFTPSFSPGRGPPAC